MHPGGGWATFLRAWQHARLDGLQGGLSLGRGLSAAPWGMGSQSCKPDSISEASESSKFWISPPPSISLKSFPKTSISHICPAPLGLFDPPPKKKKQNKKKRQVLSRNQLTGAWEKPEDILGHRGFSQAWREGMGSGHGSPLAVEGASLGGTQGSHTAGW